MTSTHNGLAGRHSSVVSPLKIQKVFLNMVEIIFGKHKDPRSERQKHVLGKEYKTPDK